MLATGLAPQGMVFDPTTKRLFVNNLNSRSVTVYDLADSLTYGFGNVPVTTTIGTVANELFSPQVLLGKQVFYNASDVRMSEEGYTSCAICHQDGDHDGRTWDFTDRGEGLRNTINLRGRAGMGHGNVHWSANFNEIQDFELDIRNAFGGTGFINGTVNPSLGAANAGRSADLDALAAYVTSLGSDSIEKSPFKNPDGSLTAEAVLGRQLFDGTLTPSSGTALTCASCHNPATDFTDSATGARHNVGTIKASSGKRLGGTLDGIDSPTLLGVHASAPYFHDGSAATLDDVFNAGRSGAASGENNNVHDTRSGKNLRPDDNGKKPAHRLSAPDRRHSGDSHRTRRHRRRQFGIAGLGRQWRSGLRPGYRILPRDRPGPIWLRPGRGHHLQQLHGQHRGQWRDLLLHCDGGGH
ncbi:MAG: hypothetical protein HC901_02135 [Bdellovibrionaceae bacterium]|nr:hypothetical protein [Pseudobdellovibrionaceae bacterium]